MQLSLLEHYGEHSHGQGGSEGRSRGTLGSTIAAVLKALTHVGVVLLQDSLVAIILVLFVATGPDDPDVASHILVDLPTDGIIFTVRRTILEIFHGLRHWLITSSCGLIMKWVAALGVSEGGALVAL